MKELHEVFLEKYPKNGKIISLYENAIGQPMTWQSVNKANLSRFAAFLQDNVATTSAKTYCAYLKAVLNLYSDQVDLPKGWERSLSVKSEPSEHIYLTEAEIARIMHHRPMTKGQAIVQQQFLLSCLTGARHSDAMRMTDDNIVEGKVVYISQKTKIKAIVPLSPAVRSILETGMIYEGYPEQYKFAYRESVSDTAYNDILRDIAYKCRIRDKVKLYAQGGYQTKQKWELIASHCGRRSFCTNLYLRSKDLYMVSKLAGHSSIEMTTRYICAPIEEVPRSVMAYFENFK